jgi:hypothetical protein
VRGAADVHVLDEAHLGADAAREVEQAGSSPSLTPAITTVSSLSSSKPAARAAAMPSSTRGEVVASRQHAERLASSVSRLTVTRCRPAARSAAACSRSSTPLVVIAEVRDRRPLRQHADQHRQIRAQQRLTAGQAHLVDAEADEHVDEPPISSNDSTLRPSAARRSPPPACSTGTAGCSGR